MRVVLSVLLLAAAIAGLAFVLAGGDGPSLGEGPTTRDGTAPATEPVLEAPALVDTREIDRVEETGEAAQAPIGDEEGVAEDPYGGKETTELHVVVVTRGDERRLAGCKIGVEWADVSSGSGSARVTTATPVETDEYGEVEIAVPVGSHVFLEVDANDDATLPHSDAQEMVEPLAPGERRTVYLVVPLMRDMVFFGRVVAAAGGAPLSGAEIRTHAAGEVVTRSDAFGIFSLPVPSQARGEKVYRIDHSNFGYALFAPRLGHELRERALDLRLRVSGEIVVIAPPAAAGSNRREVRVTTSAYEITEPDGEFISGEDVLWSAPIDAAGHGSVTGVAARVPLKVSIRVGFTTVYRFAADVVLDEGERRELSWRPSEDARLQVFVVDQHGLPVADQAIVVAGSVSGHRAAPGGLAILSNGDDDEVLDTRRTDDWGRVFFELPAGSYWVGPRPLGRDAEQTPESISATAQAVQILPGSTQVDLELKAWRGLYVKGRVVAPSGDPPEQGAFIFGYTEKGRAVIHASASGDGSFTLGPLPREPFTLVANAFTSHVASEPVTANPGDGEVVLRLREAGSLTGRVLDRDSGRPRTASMIFSGPGGALMMSGVNSDGEYHASGLAPGGWSVAASTLDGDVGLRTGVTVAAGAETRGIDVLVAPGARVVVAYHGASEYAQLRVLANGACVEADGIHTGAEIGCVVPIGEVRVLLKDRTREEETVVTLAQGEEKRVTFDWREEATDGDG